VEAGEARYGSDRTGLLCGYLFTPGQPGSAIDGDEAAAVLASTDVHESFLWLHFNLANQISVRWMRQHLELPEEYHSLLDHVTSTRVEVANGSLVAVINDVALYGLDPSTVSTMALFVNHRVLVSARHTPLRSAERLRECVKAGETFRSTVEILAHLLRDQADVLVQIVREATGQVDRIEDKIIATHIGTSRPKLSALRRVLVRLQRLLAPEPAALFRLLNRAPPWISEADRQDLRQSVEELAAAVSDSSALVERMRLLQEELLALLNEQTNRTLFVLTVVTVVALPMTIIPGLFGMNVGGIPLEGHPWGFWLVLMVVTGLAVLSAYLAFHKRSDS
jgi:zinc transporter